MRVSVAGGRLAGPEAAGRTWFLQGSSSSSRLGWMLLCPGYWLGPGLASEPGAAVRPCRPPTCLTFAPPTWRRCCSAAACAACHLVFPHFLLPGRLPDRCAGRYRGCCLPRADAPPRAAAAAGAALLQRPAKRPSPHALLLRMCHTHTHTHTCCRAFLFLQAPRTPPPTASSWSPSAAWWGP